MTPTIGRIVWYVNEQDSPGEFHPGIISAVNTPPDASETTVDLHVFYKNASDAVTGIPFSESWAPNTWTWPPRA